ncbi:unnamed protein product [Darwinula stevensoni]|uniref:Purine nucleoside phosphorylase n=1 Tax=Darwinula stevensoni TaxID=69355 RepID=A0A7R9A7A4_9CRUS|nr:unnamed protein product [Darwinula stevensoni]CAG0892401.1 unnamed protein product [Darwinula stevensoni]
MTQKRGRPPVPERGQDIREALSFDPKNPTMQPQEDENPLPAARVVQKKPLKSRPPIHPFDKSHSTPVLHSSLPLGSSARCSSPSLTMASVNVQSPVSHSTEVSSLSPRVVQVPAISTMPKPGVFPVISSSASAAIIASVNTSPSKMMAVDAQSRLGTGVSSPNVTMQNQTIQGLVRPPVTALFASPKSSSVSNNPHLASAIEGISAMSATMSQFTSPIPTTSRGTPTGGRVSSTRIASVVTKGGASMLVIATPSSTDPAVCTYHLYMVSPGPCNKQGNVTGPQTLNKTPLRSEPSSTSSQPELSCTSSPSEPVSTSSHSEPSKISSQAEPTLETREVPDVCCEQEIVTSENNTHGKNVDFESSPTESISVLKRKHDAEIPCSDQVQKLSEEESNTSLPVAKKKRVSRRPQPKMVQRKPKQVPQPVGLVYSMETSARPMNQSMVAGKSRKRHAITAIENIPGSKKPGFQHGGKHQKRRKPRRQGKRKYQLALVPDTHGAKGKDTEKRDVSSENSGQVATFKPEARLPKKPEEASANWKKLLQMLPKLEPKTDQKPAKYYIEKRRKLAELKKKRKEVKDSKVRRVKPKQVEEVFGRLGLESSPRNLPLCDLCLLLLKKPHSFQGLTKVIAMDCEMVGVGEDGSDSIIARVSIVNHFGHCVYDKFVKPTERVTDYRTKVSGVTPELAANGEEFEVVQKEVAEILNGRILVGHALKHDLNVLFLSHPRKKLRDTSRFRPFRALFNGKTPSLKNLCAQLLGVTVQVGEHSSVQDAQAAMRLYTMYRKQWESEMKEMKVGIIAGTGLANLDLLSEPQEWHADTIFGKPSDVLIHGKISGVDCVLLSRHGRKHSIMPSNINFRANVWALKEAGCTHILVSSACGSLREDYAPGDLVLFDQFIDRTTIRSVTFFDGSPMSPPGICHLPMDTPFCPHTRELLREAAQDLGLKCHLTGTVVTVEGPRFSSKAESRMFRAWGGDVINMTTFPEVVLAKEAGLCYAAIGMVTDYDSWRHGSNDVHVDLNMVKSTLQLSGKNLIEILTHAVPKVAAKDWKSIIQANKSESSCLPLMSHMEEPVEELEDDISVVFEDKFPSDYLSELEEVSRNVRVPADFERDTNPYFHPPDSTQAQGKECSEKSDKKFLWSLQDKVIATALTKEILESGLLLREDQEFLQEVLHMSDASKTLIHELVSWKEVGLGLLLALSCGWVFGPMVSAALVLLPASGYAGWRWWTRKSLRDRFRVHLAAVQSANRILHSCLIFLQERIYIAKGFTLLVDRRCTGSWLTGLDSSSPHFCTNLREAVLKVTLKLQETFATSTQKLIQEIPLVCGLENPCDYLHLLLLKMEDADGLKLTRLKVLCRYEGFSMMLAHQSEFFRRLALSLQSHLCEAQRPVQTVLKVMEAFDYVQGAGEGLERSLQLQRASLRSSTKEIAPQDPEGPRDSYLKPNAHVFVHSLTLHLEAALAKALKLEEDVARATGDLDSEFEELRLELLACLDCLEEGRKHDKGMEGLHQHGSEMTSPAMFEMKETKYVPLEPYVPEDQIFEAEAEDTFNFDDGSGNEEILLQRKILKEESQNLLRELRHVLVFRAAEWRQRELQVYNKMGKVPTEEEPLQDPLCECEEEHDLDEQSWGHNRIQFQAADNEESESGNSFMAGMLPVNPHRLALDAALLSKNFSVGDCNTFGEEDTDSESDQEKLDPDSSRGLWHPPRMSARRLLIKVSTWEKWGQYWKGVLQDYKDVGKGIVLESKNRPLKTAIYGFGLAAVCYTIHANPNKQHFHDRVKEVANEIATLPEHLRNPRAVKRTDFLVKALRDGEVRVLSLGLFSLAWVDNHHPDCDLYWAQCRFLRPRYVTFHERVVDVGFLGRWLVLEHWTSDYDNGSEKSLFVTVGTTSFDLLVATVTQSNFLSLLSRLGYKKLVLQIGRGTFQPDVMVSGRLMIEWFRHKPSIEAEIQAASLVISHAGAGTCLEVLGAQKPHIVVVNEDLMGNHQMELAQKLYEEGHLLYCTCETLLDTLQSADLSALRPFHRGSPREFAEFLDTKIDSFFCD